MRLTILISALSLSMTCAWATSTPRVALPDYSNWVLYHTSDRGSVVEDMYAPKELIETMKTAEVFPYGARILLIEYFANGGNKSGIRRYIVMQKEKGWGASYAPDIRNGEWEYQAYHGNRVPFAETEDPVSRCLSCHLSAKQNDYVYSLDALRAKAH